MALPKGLCSLFNISFSYPHPLYPHSFLPLGLGGRVSSLFFLLSDFSLFLLLKISSLEFHALRLFIIYLTAADIYQIQDIAPCSFENLSSPLTLSNTTTLFYSCSCTTSTQISPCLIILICISTFPSLVTHYHQYTATLSFPTPPPLAGVLFLCSYLQRNSWDVFSTLSPIPLPTFCITRLNPTNGHHRNCSPHI